MQKVDTQEFEVNNVVRQRYSPSAILFNSAVEYVLKNIDKHSIRTKAGHIIAYINDLVIVSERREMTKKVLEEIVTERGNMSLKINQGKTEKNAARQETRK